MAVNLAACVTSFLSGLYHTATDHHKYAYRKNLMDTPGYEKISYKGYPLLGWHCNDFLGFIIASLIWLDFGFNGETCPCTSWPVC